ncbi:hypothetical protein [Polyangium sorediatum]|uniref:Uncharacterized protein n=1 Tax=Polyangium sorediatum TaxID=889274 RepID=A0ABT6NPI2_9BACT|nr:hypothetical protein [Polyangium sorediatum]MDI1430230.1 hypothetical protein [Polyangium sorediatum]
MRKLTDEVRAELRRTHGGDLRLIEVEDREGVAVVVKPPTRKAWAAAFDGLSKPAGRPDALHNLLIDCVAWPDAAALSAVLEEVPALSELAWPVLAELAGAPDEELQTIPLAKLGSDDWIALAAAGLAETRCAELAAEARGTSQRVAVRMPTGLWLLKCPSSSQYTASRRLTAQGKVFDGLYRLSLNAIEWPTAEAVAAVFERSPGLGSAVGEVVMELAGAGAKLRVGGI